MRGLDRAPNSGASAPNSGAPYVLLIPMWLVQIHRYGYVHIDMYSYEVHTYRYLQIDMYSYEVHTYRYICTDQEVQLRTGSTSTRRSTKYGYDDKIADTVANFL